MIMIKVLNRAIVIGLAVAAGVCVNYHEFGWATFAALMCITECLP